MRPTRTAPGIGALLIGVAMVFTSVIAPSSPAAATMPPRAAADQSGTLVFIRNDNVWISKANGAGARALTRDGTSKSPYRTPTQDDRGHVYALRGHAAKAMVSRLDQRGHVLTRYGVPIRSLGPDFVSVSIDGTKLAYGTMFATTDCSFTPCHTIFQHSVAYAVAATGKPLSGAHDAANSDFASWAGGTRVVLQTRRLNVVALHRPSEKKAIDWFASCLSYEEGCQNTDTLNYTPALNRQGTRLAVSRLEDNNGQKRAYLLVLSTTNATTGNPPPAPGAGCAHAAAAPTVDFPGRTDLTISAPSFSPNGSSVVFAQRTGSSWDTRVYTPVIGNCSASDPVTVLHNAAEPHWSAAPLSRPALIWNSAKHPALKGAKRAVQVGSTLSLAMKKKAIRKAFSPDATAVRFQWLRDSRPIKHATKATYRVHKADRGKKINIRITGIRKGHVKATVTSRATRIR